MAVPGRRQRILDALVGEYVCTAEPVGSTTLVRRYHLGVSPATVRSELSALEGDGLVRSPHTSAGRVPTDSGYRAVVDELLGELEEARRPASAGHGETPAGGGADSGATVPEASVLARWHTLEEQATRELASVRGASDLDAVLAGVAGALTRLTSCLAAVAAPSAVAAAPRRVSLVSVTTRLCVVVVVGQDGSVTDRHVTLPVEVEADRLADLESRLNEVLCGRQRTRAAELAERDPSALAALIGSTPLAERIIAEVCACLAEQPNGRPRPFGLASLLEQPEFADPAAAVPLAQMIEDGRGLSRLLDGVGQVEGVFVRIGIENGSAAPTMGVVAQGYSVADAQGLVAVIGPTRMDYAKAIAAVRAAAAALETTLS